MRITNQMLYSTFNNGYQNNMSQAYKTDEQLSSGQKINSPSDDPAAITTIITGKAELASIATYQDAGNTVSSLLNATSTAFDSLNSFLSTAKSAGNGAATATPTEMTQYASTITNIIQSVIGIANTQVNGKYIFSGYKSDQPAVNTSTGLFQGTSDKIKMEISAGVSIDSNVTADEIIAQPTAPISIAAANSALITTAAPGYTSPTSILSPNGGTLALSLNGGAAVPVPIAAGATLSDVRDAINKANSGIHAEVVNQNMNGSPASYQLMLSATPTSSASAITVGITATPDPAGTGLNTLAVNAGVGTMKSVVSPDTTILGTLDILKTAISQGDVTTIQRAVSDLGNLSTSIMTKQSDVGARLGMVQSEQQYLTSRDNTVTNEVADKLTLSTTDIAALSAQATQQQVALQSLRTITSNVLSTSLFDFIK